MSLTQAWNEAYPAGTTAANLIDDAMTQMKTQVREVISADHVMASNESAGSANTGYHNKATFVEQASSPTLVANTLMLFAKEVTSKTELFMDSYDSTTAEMQLTSNGDWIGGPRGGIIMWSGALASIPTGWALCDGDESRPDLAAKFIRGIATDSTEPGGTGGSETHTHTVDSHTHSIAHTHTYSGNTGGQVNSAASAYSSSSGTFIEHHHAYSGTTSAVSSDNSGGTALTSNATSTLPSYYALAFIIKT